MPVRVYATKEQYASFAEEPFDGEDGVLTKRLRSASVEVEKLTRLSVFAVDEGGMPTDAEVLGAFIEATCAIVEHWQETDDPFGVEATQGAVKIGSVSIGTTSSSSDGLSPRERLARRIGDKALDILTNAGLITASIAYS